MTVPAGAWTGTPPTSWRPMARVPPGKNWLPSSSLRLGHAAAPPLTDAASASSRRATAAASAPGRS